MLLAEQVIFQLLQKKMGVTKITGLDLSSNMLAHFNDKAEWSKGNLVQSVAEFMPFKNESFTNITVAFGARNFYNIKQGFESFYRVLKPNGKVTILEFRLPKNKIVKGLYNFYFNKVLPAIGKIVSKDNEAYTYLPESVNAFDEKVALKELLSETNFTNIKTYSLTLGIVQVVIAEK